MPAEIWQISSWYGAALSLVLKNRTSKQFIPTGLQRNSFNLNTRFDKNMTCRCSHHNGNSSQGLRLTTMLNLYRLMIFNRFSVIFADSHVTLTSCRPSALSICLKFRASPEKKKHSVLLRLRQRNVKRLKTNRRFECVINCGGRHKDVKDMIDHRSYTHNFSSCEKPEKKFQAWAHNVTSSQLD